MSDFAQFHDPYDGSNVSPIKAADKTLYGRNVVIRRAFIKSIENLTYDTYALVVKYQGAGEDIRPHAGQYATLKPDHLIKPRAYSFARAPEKENPGEHTFYVRLLKGGLFSEWLFEKDRLNEPLTLSGPVGKFGLDDSDKLMLCVAGGSGMSAIYALLEHATCQQIKRNAIFLYGARSQKDLYLVDEIQSFSKAWHPQYKLEFIPVLSAEPQDSGWQGARGNVTDYMRDQFLDNSAIDIDSTVAYFCGPPPMIDLGIQELTSKGMAAESIRYDKFEDARSPAPVIDNTKCVLCDECLMVRPTENCIVEAARVSTDGNGDGAEYEPITPGKTAGLYYNALHIVDKECIRCWACVDVCPADAISPDYDPKVRALRDMSAA